ncbi:hypothetical protein H17ap60334_07493 [Thermosipho africanus H17ap60334]|nr:hypothetical protein H17ap60334_07493 [Thermosipho africanus H17ap60334]
MTIKNSEPEEFNSAIRNIVNVVSTLKMTLLFGIFLIKIVKIAKITTIKEKENVVISFYFYAN